MATLNPFEKELNESSKQDFSDLKAVFINCTLKKSPAVSHTQGLMDKSAAIMEGNGVQTEIIRAIDRDIATGVYPDMREHGWEKDDWPEIQKKVMEADILAQRPRRYSRTWQPTQCLGSR
ncbi:MAG: hypothetical protein LC670_14450 [Flavobacteriales bacterium]|nr:hypothetical protein [Flavobacteriales bacterium]